MHGWHRALAMRSRVNRGTPRVPGPGLRAGAGRLVPRPRLPHRAALASRPSCGASGRREMPTGVYDPKWLRLPHAARRRARRSPSRSAGAARTTPARCPTTELVEILRTRQRPLRQHARLPGRDRAVAAHLRHPRPRRRAPGRARAPPRADRLSAAERPAAARVAEHADARRRAPLRGRSRCRCRPGRPDRRARPRTPDSARSGGARLRRRSAR